ncbi:MAG: 2Fe-2S iron-sulfur cluster binding domain-containing protein [Tissierellia bacterium]|nr:2Fe-2S iron-sulfur cluster binding domain-containing protein [Tissierellia bacterium]
MYIINENIYIDLFSGEHIVQGVARFNSKHSMNGCCGGGCGICRIKILSGDYTTKKMSRKQVTDEEEKEGYALGCRVFPESDMSIEYVGLKNS